MNGENGTKKIQWAVFSPDRSESIVIRTDDKEEAVILRNWAKGILPSAKPFPDDEGNSAHDNNHTQEQAQDFCQMHNRQMKLRKAPDGSTFYSHAQPDKNGGWEYCSGKGWK